METKKNSDCNFKIYDNSKIMSKFTINRELSNKKLL